uniref:Secreted protein n=1 Tax=Romanomermis culicivorax TaxID=13658 RepID=A0A915HZV6_ROMCU
MCSTLAATILFVLICNMMEGKSIFAPEKAAEEFTPGNYLEPTSSLLVFRPQSALRSENFRALVLLTVFEPASCILWSEILSINR